MDAYWALATAVRATKATSNTAWTACYCGGRLLDKLGRTAEADAMFDHQIEVAKQDEKQDMMILLLRSKAERLFLSGRYEESLAASRETRQLLADEPKSRDALQAAHGEGEALSALGRYDEALRVARSARSGLSPEHPTAWTFRLHEAQALEGLGRDLDALAVFDAIIADYREIEASFDGRSYNNTYPLRSRAVEAMNRTGIPGDSEPWKGWGHGVHVWVEAPVVEAVSG